MPIKQSPKTLFMRHYQYEMMGIVYPQYAEKNILIEYGITEADK